MQDDCVYQTFAIEQSAKRCLTKNHNILFSLINTMYVLIWLRTREKNGPSLSVNLSIPFRGVCNFHHEVGI